MLAVSDGHQLHELEVLALNAMAITGDGKLLAIGGLTGAIDVVDALSMRPLAQLSGNRGGVTAIGFDPSGTHLYSGGFDEVLRRWNVSRIKTVALSSISDVLATTASAPLSLTSVRQLNDSGVK